MIGYVTIGSDDRKRAGAFYDAILGDLGAKRAMENERMVGWSGANGVMLLIMEPYNKEPAKPGNGTMIALAAKDTAQVDALHAKALSLGASDEGAPGPRDGAPGFYGSYFRDLDGNKVAVFHYQT